MSINFINERSKIIDEVLGSVTKDFLIKETDSVELTVFKYLSKQVESQEEKKLLLLIVKSRISNHIDKISAEAFNPISAADTIEGLMSGIQQIGRSKRPNFTAFENDFLNTMKLKKDKEISELLRIKMELLKSSLAYYDKEVHGNIVSVLYESYEPSKDDDYEVLSDDAYETLVYAITKGEQRPSAVREVDDNTFSLDFGEYCYLFDKQLNQDLFDNLTEQDNQINKVSNGLKDKFKTNNEVGFALGTIANTIGSHLSKELEESMVKHGKSISAVAFDYLERNSEEVLNRVDDLDLKEKDVLAPLIKEYLSKSFVSKESLSDFCTQTRNSRFKSPQIDFDEMDKIFDKNVDEVMEHYNEGNTFMFRQKLNGLNSLEKIAVNLRIDEIETKKDDLPSLSM